MDSSQYVSHGLHFEDSIASESVDIGAEQRDHVKESAVTI